MSNAQLKLIFRRYRFVILPFILLVVNGVIGVVFGIAVALAVEP